MQGFTEDRMPRYTYLYENIGNVYKQNYLGNESIELRDSLKKDLPWSTLLSMCWAKCRGGKVSSNSTNILEAVFCMKPFNLAL